MSVPVESVLCAEEGCVPEKIAVLCSDLHLSHSPPIARSGESDWYEAMARPLRELVDLSDKGAVLVLCGGDVFDRWNTPPKLITFAMKLLPMRFSSVLGQHDLPYHDWQQRESSAFWTLVEANTIELAFGWKNRGRVAWQGFQWGQEIKTNNLVGMGHLKTVCVAHQYVWTFDSGAPAGMRSKDAHVSTLGGRLAGYNVVLLGDNHRGFLHRLKNTIVFNAGTFMRRCMDERDYLPMVGILREDGSVEPHYLDTSHDVFDVSDAVREAEQVMLNLDLFLRELQELGETGLDFRRAVEVAMDREQVSRAVRRIVLDVMEKGRDT